MMEQQELLQQNLTKVEKEKESECRATVEELKTKIKEKESTIKQREDDEFRKAIEYQKLQALLEQKLSLTESDLKDYKAKWGQKDSEIKELNKELLASRKELATVSERLRLETARHTDEVEALKEEIAQAKSLKTEQPMSSVEQQLNLLRQTI
jgi:hypothetical protein